ncbi:MAG: flagellar motor protein MotB [Gammaproteobacteria bacterium]|nr:MAG: flagellar motor protein MotB [Gammaproteobacteria bacterium]PIE37314.1 MAG: flagellar motor protein MotB [Gammaproteobacteria bacterium]
MKKELATLGFSATLLIASQALFAQEDETPIAVPDTGAGGYVASDGSVVKTGSGDCLHDSSYSADAPINACEGIEEMEEAPAVEETAVEEPPPEPAVTSATLDGEALFDTDSATLGSVAEQQVMSLVEQLRGFDEITAISVVGHTDSRGAEAYNQALSERRANAVADYLSAALPDVEITASGAGESEPVSSNDTPEGRQLNRRVFIQATASSITN